MRRRPADRPIREAYVVDEDIGRDDRHNRKIGRVVKNPASELRDLFSGVPRNGT